MYIRPSFQTQPVPNPLSYYFHQSPEILHKFETLSNHFIELIVPWFLLLPGRFTIACGIIQIIFQVSCLLFIVLLYIETLVDEVLLVC